MTVAAPPIARARDVRTNLTVPAAPGIGVTITERFNFAQHTHTRGTVFCDRIGTCTLTWRAAPGGAVVFTKDVPAAAAPNPANTFAWDEPMRGPYLEIAFTNTSGLVSNAWRLDVNAYVTAAGAGGGGGGSTATSVNAAHVDFTSGALGAGTNDVTFRTVPAANNSKILSVVCAYTGTVAGVTLQLRIGGVLVDLPIGGLVSGTHVRVLVPGQVILADAGETWQVRVTGATAGDTINVLAHFEEET